MKECAVSAVYCEKVRFCLQCNYKQLWLNFNTINELSLVIYRYRISEWQGGGPSRKIMEIPGGGGSTLKPTWNGKSWGVGGQTGKNPPWEGMDIFWNHKL